MCMFPGLCIVHYIKKKLEVCQLMHQIWVSSVYSRGTSLYNIVRWEKYYSRRRALRYRVIGALAQQNSPGAAHPRSRWLSLPIVYGKVFSKPSNNRIVSSHNNTGQCHMYSPVRRKAPMKDMNLCTKTRTFVTRTWTLAHQIQPKV